jgi:hypothetical protein
VQVNLCKAIFHKAESRLNGASPQWGGEKPVKRGKTVGSARQKNAGTARGEKGDSRDENPGREEEGPPAARGRRRRQNRGYEKKEGSVFFIP